jgi:hypothetical protein
MDFTLSVPCCSSLASAEKGASIMEDTTYTKGIYTATIGVRAIDSGQYQGLVSLLRDDGEGNDATVYEVHASSENETEALAEARALAHRILGEIEL